MDIKIRLDIRYRMPNNPPIKAVKYICTVCYEDEAREFSPTRNLAGLKNHLERKLQEIPGVICFPQHSILSGGKYIFDIIVTINKIGWLEDLSITRDEYIKKHDKKVRAALRKVFTLKRLAGIKKCEPTSVEFELTSTDVK